MRSNHTVESHGSHISRAVHSRTPQAPAVAVGFMACLQAEQKVLEGTRQQLWQVKVMGVRGRGAAAGLGPPTWVHQLA
jgi:hypothetical protein